MASAPIRVDRTTSSPRAKFKGYYGIDVDISDPLEMTRRALDAISVKSLMVFLTTMATEYFEDEIIDRFAYEGDDKSGNWAPLKESTVRIREALGYDGSDPINERTQELLKFVAFNRAFFASTDWAQMDVPGSPNSASVAAKLATAQQGNGMNMMIPGATTQPRPVLATGEDDMASLLTLLELHIMQRISGGFGSANVT